MPDLSVIVPTRNESANIKNLIKGIWDALVPYKPELRYEVVVVDDSTDNTAEIARSFGAKVIKGRRLGLAQAVLDGIDQTDKEFIIVMDADGQHPTSLLPKVVEQLKYHDLVVMTKHTKEATADMSWWRKLQSNMAVWLTHVMIPVPVSDPMAGFFGIRRRCFSDIPRGEYVRIDYEKLKKKADDLEASLPEGWDGMDDKIKTEWYLQNGYATKIIGLEAIGFKIGLELFTKAKWVSHMEIPMAFLKREAGMSKGTRHSLQKHLWHLFKNSLNYEVELPKGSEEYYYFYEANGWQKNWKQDIAKVLNKISYDLKPERTLDVGCGSSPNINYLYGDRIGIDINEKAIEFIKGYSSAQFQIGNVMDIPFSNDSFDMVVCVEVLEHLYPKEVEKAMSELARVLKPKGHAILATPNYKSVLWNIIETAQRLVQKGHWTSDHHTKFNRKSLGKLCKRFSLEEISYNGIQKNMDMVVTYQKI